MCYHCGEPGHEKRACFKLNGCPEWWTGPRDGSAGRGSNGGGRGSGRGQPAGMANAAYSRQNHTSSSSPQVGSGDCSSFPGLSDSQWCTLVTMFQSQASASNDGLSGKN